MFTLRCPRSGEVHPHFAPSQVVEVDALVGYVLYDMITSCPLSLKDSGYDATQEELVTQDTTQVALCYDEGW